MPTQNGPGDDIVPPKNLAEIIESTKEHGRRGEWKRTATLAEQGLEICLKSDASSLAFLKFALGTALLYFDPIRAARIIKEAITRLARLPHMHDLLAPAYNNLAFAQRFLDQCEEEVRSWTAAAERYARCGQPIQALMCRVEIAWTASWHAHTDMALAQLQEVQTQLGSADNPELLCELQLAWGLYHQCVGNTTESDNVCTSLLKRADVHDRQRADAMWILGRNALERGDAQAMDHWVTEGLIVAETEWWPLQMKRLRSLQGHIPRNLQ